jgi:hypothetical protein
MPGPLRDFAGHRVSVFCAVGPVGSHPRVNGGVEWDVQSPRRIRCFGQSVIGRAAGSVEPESVACLSQLATSLFAI